jgi:hypothetical protein
MTHSCARWSITWPGALTLAARYDDRKRLVDLDMAGPAGPTSMARYRYDAADRTRISSLGVAASETTLFDYDAAHRLTIATHDLALPLPRASTQPQQDAQVTAALAAASAAGTTTSGFDYDDADARLRATQTGQPDVVYANLPGHVPASAGGERFTYDADGVRHTAGRSSRAP